MLIYVAALINCFRFLVACATNETKLWLSPLNYFYDAG